MGKAGHRPENAKTLLRPFPDPIGDSLVFIVDRDVFKYKVEEIMVTRVICSLIGLSFLMSSAAWAVPASKSVRDGNRLYQQGNFEDAARRYEEALGKTPESVIVNFNAGTALYKQKRFAQAARYLQKALLSDDPRLKEKAHYNLGNTLYQSGVGNETKDIGAAIQALQESLAHFESALHLDKTDKDAQYNHEFVKKELERLKQKQKQQPSPGEKKNQASQQGQEHPSESQAKETQGSRGQPSPAAGGQQQSGQPGEDQKKQAVSAVDNSKDLTKEEAERILQSYQQAEEPRGLLKVFQNKGESRPVLKDW